MCLCVFVCYVCDVLGYSKKEGGVSRFPGFSEDWKFGYFLGLLSEDRPVRVCLVSGPLSSEGLGAGEPIPSKMDKYCMFLFILGS